MQKIRDKGVTMKVSELMSKENCNEVGYTQPYVRKLPSKTKGPSKEQEAETGEFLVYCIILGAAIWLFFVIFKPPYLTWIFNWFSQYSVPITVLVATGILFIIWVATAHDVLDREAKEKQFEFTFPNAHRTSSTSSSSDDDDADGW